MSVRTLARLVNSDRSFPRPIRPSSHMVLFRRDELEAYFDSKRRTALRPAPTKEPHHEPA